MSYIPLVDSHHVSLLHNGGDLLDGQSQHAKPPGHQSATCVVSVLGPRLVHEMTLMAISYLSRVLPPRTRLGKEAHYDTFVRLDVAVASPRRSEDIGELHNGPNLLGHLSTGVPVELNIYINYLV